MKKQYDLSQLNWTVSGWAPHLWRLERTMEIGASPNADITAVPAKVPGSVQLALREAGLIPDWNMGLNYRLCEWVENRHWIYEASIPDEWLAPGKTFRLNCLGLDYRGSVMLNGKQVGEFNGSYTPHVFDLTPHLGESGNVLRIIFELPPRWLGQFGFTSKMKEWKVRFNYTWDWTVRLVQVGVWEPIMLEVTDGQQIEELRCWTDISGAEGSLQIRGRVSAADGAAVAISLSRGKTVHTLDVPASQFNSEGISLDIDQVGLWWPNNMGEQPLYDLRFELMDAQGRVLDSRNCKVGFKHIEWEQCEGAPAGADPWICVVNGKPVFLQGANWTPVLPNFADATEERYRSLVQTYKDLGFNILRVWGGAYLEKQWFYDLCDEMGLMVWQEFPLSSSGIENDPPRDEVSVESMAQVAESCVARRQHHVSLTLWSGGNELESPKGVPVDLTHPMIARFAEIVKGMDPTRRFLPSSPSGPKAVAGAADFGKGIHWDTHGPWKATGDLSDGWTDYFTRDDSLFRSETGSPGASSAELIQKYAGGCQVLPVEFENPYWRRNSTWWVEHEQFIAERGRAPETLEEYVEWSQERQKRALTIAVECCKNKFPKCGGIIIWMGHDCFPCAANTSLIDFEGKPKPAGLAVGDIFRGR